MPLLPCVAEPGTRAVIAGQDPGLYRQLVYPSVDIPRPGPGMAGSRHVVPVVRTADHTRAIASSLLWMLSRVPSRGAEASARKLRL
jgi:hypothetical protein